MREQSLAEREGGEKQSVSNRERGTEKLEKQEREREREIQNKKDHEIRD